MHFNWQICTFRLEYKYSVIMNYSYKINKVGSHRYKHTSSIWSRLTDLDLDVLMAKEKRWHKNVTCTDVQRVTMPNLGPSFQVNLFRAINDMTKYTGYNKGKVWLTLDSSMHRTPSRHQINERSLRIYLDRSADLPHIRLFPHVFFLILINKQHNWQ